MKIYTVPVCCDLCGGPGVATPRGSASQWTGGRLIHSNPSICESYIREKQEKDAKRIAELEAQVASA
jgi:hypothetical protein